MSELNPVTSEAEAYQEMLEAENRDLRAGVVEVIGILNGFCEAPTLGKWPSVMRDQADKLRKLLQ